jgi:receptor expression-enhancing protein 1/2/3/4
MQWPDPPFFRPIHSNGAMLVVGWDLFDLYFVPSCRLVLGYAYPAYDCYKTVELNRPEVEQLRFWCQYWSVDCAPSSVLVGNCVCMSLHLIRFMIFFCRILLAVLTVLERVGENFVSW